MKYLVTLRNAAGREEQITIHEATSANAASNKAVREASVRFGGSSRNGWYVVRADEKGSEIRA